ncbi:bifunctional isocitrate dehydrogenase kinase/phosphatase [Neptuniibacter caesariensis]|uniref:Isocitrate dehydrogenase kinase/phosphatase n=1 Tax=Neptuniibacter caesariensis TaxID=207954 RepID=A0A7U8C224_NEPCE|nr:bifunctional isocitrate dehydrogenase kinase/phosphatase [Neptuniibacter caesariensis]EAR60063.1 bifunctional isocitrate dehydrogenase kinase/phosphatase protein [Neptuniibacter caesariensis]
MRRQTYQRIAAQVMVFFAEYRLSFQEITDCAQSYFESANWREIQTLSSERIDLYEEMVEEAAAALEQQLGDSIYQPLLWHQAKSYYSKLIKQRTDPELAETFYNSVYCRLFQHHLIDSENMFIESTRTGKEISSGDSIYSTYSTDDSGLVQLLGRMLDEVPLNLAWEHKRRDIRNLIVFMRDNAALDVLGQLESIDLVNRVFFRNKAAYLVGRLKLEKGSQPFVLPVLNNDDGGLYIDTALTHEDDVSIVFSFTRSYFLVEVDVPSEFVSFLHSLIPEKSRAELYSSIGFYKQGKAEFYRSLQGHLKATDDQFVIAPGIRGMVMSVFTLPSYPVVFKIIKDRFSSSKNVTREVVKQKYQLVKKHDRVGRMADTQEFTNFSFPRERFSDHLLEELKEVAGSSIYISGNEVVIRHLWTERYMTPLNMYIDSLVMEEDLEGLRHVIDEYGKAIKQLAAANIFAGDMLFKNFGVTRHGRVVFYDYDEILYLTDCNFREVPKPIYPEQELASEPWYSVAENDVFPEEFAMLTACHQKIRAIFNELHGDLLSVPFWKQAQDNVRSGVIVDVFPYRGEQRFNQLKLS